MVGDHYFTSIKYSNQLPTQRHLSGVHNVHVWMPCSNINVLDPHVYCCEADRDILEQIKAKINIGEPFRIGRSTL